jgi:K+-transporting ATPase KdpF subunit
VNAFEARPRPAGGYGPALHQENPLPTLYFVSALIASGLFVYLVLALLKPELFS